MKYYEQLNKLETSIIEVELIKANLRVVANGVECSNFDDVSSAIECITSNLEEKMVDVMANFTFLFKEIYDDTHKDDLADKCYPTNL